MVLCAVPGGSCFSMMHCGRMRVAMLLVRQVARPDAAGSAGCSPEGALLCAVELLPDGAVRFLCRQLLLDDAGGASAKRQALPRCRRIGFRGAATSSAQTCASLHSSRSASLAGTLPFTMDMGVHGLCGRVPDSTGSFCPQGVDTPLRSKLLTAVFHLKHHLPSCSCSPARLQPHPAQVHQIASQTGVLPRRMRFVAGRGHCSSKSPRGRILVLGTSGAHWPARWPRFELTERVAKSQLSGY